MKPAWSDNGSASPASVWLGIILGMALGVAVVVAIGRMNPPLPWPMRAVLLGALTGVLLAPILAISSFLSMLVLPFSLEGVIGDSAWSRLATALHHRRLAPLIFPLFFYVVLPMLFCAYGAARMKPTGPSLLPTAGLGAALLGAILGGICGGFLGRRQQTI